MGMIKCKNSFYLKESIAPQAFYIDAEDIYYFDKTNKHEGRLCIRDNCGERCLYQIDDGYGIFDNKGNMHILNISMESGTTKYSRKNRPCADLQLEGIFYDIKVDEDGNYIFLGNDDGKTIIRLTDENYNEKKTIIPKGIIFGSSLFINEENIYLGAVGENDRLKVLKMNYIGRVLECYDIDIKSRDRIIGKIDIIENYLIILISGKKESIVLYDMASKSEKEIFIYQLGLINAFDICINKNSISVLSERKIVEFELNELWAKKILPSSIPFKISPDTGLYMKMMCSLQLYECIYKYLYISFFISIFECFILYIFKIINHYGFFEIITFITAFTLITNYCFGIISSIFSLSRKQNRIEKLLCVSNKKYSQVGIFLTSLLNSIAAAAILFLILLPEVYLRLYLLSGILLFLVDIYINNSARRRVALLQRDIIIELLEDDDIQVKKYIKNFSENMNRDNINTLRINIVSDKSIDANIAALWLKSRKYILKNEVQCAVNENSLTALLDLSYRDIKYSKYNIIMDFVCYIRLKTRVRELKIEIIDHDPAL